MKTYKPKEVNIVKLKTYLKKLVSYAGLTDIVGSPVPSLVSAFELRVVTDGGIMEANSCLNTELTFLNSIQ